MEKENVLVAWCKQNKTDYKKLISLMGNFAKVESLVKKHNEEHISQLSLVSIYIRGY